MPYLIKTIQNSQMKKWLRKPRQSACPRDLYDEEFSKTSFTRTVFDEKKLVGCTFKGCTFQDASFLDTEVRDCMFLGCDLRDATFNGSDFSTSSFVDSSLNYVYILNNTKLPVGYEWLNALLFKDIAQEKQAQIRIDYPENPEEQPDYVMEMILRNCGQL